jgi:hypothetical protein
MNSNQREGKQGQPAMYRKKAFDQSSAEPRREFRAKHSPACKVGYRNAQEAAAEQQARCAPEQEIGGARALEVTMPPQREHRPDSQRDMHPSPGLGLNGPRSARRIWVIVQNWTWLRLVSDRAIHKATPQCLSDTLADCYDGRHTKQEQCRYACAVGADFGSDVTRLLMQHDYSDSARDGPPC